MFNNLYNAAGEIRTLLMPFAFILCVIGIGEMGWRAGSDSRAILGALLKMHCHRDPHCRLSRHHEGRPGLVH